MINKFDYIYINPHLHILGRLSDVEYGNDEQRGVHLGVGSNLAGAYEIAQYHQNNTRCPYGIKITEKININPD